MMLHVVMVGGGRAKVHFSGEMENYARAGREQSARMRAEFPSAQIILYVDFRR